MARDVAAQIRVLGAIDAVDERGNNLGLGGRVQGRLLAVLVAGAPAAIGIDSLCDALWAGDDAPADRVASLRTYVARARAVLGTGSIVTATGSYRLGDVDTDRRRFEELIERARRASGSPTVADLWRQALDLWRGPAFGDFADLETVQAEANRLEELRAEATEAWFDARLAAGEGRELAADVDRAVAEFPLREGFRVQQMTVLSRAGRQGEALRAFQEFRADLTEIGLEPSARLVELDKQIAAGGTPRSGARRTLRGYELGDRIGEGAFAVVYRATQASVGRAVAVKQIRGQLADQPAFIAQFEAEAHLVARLEHPHIVPLYDFWREPGSAFLVMRYLDGGSLGQRLVEGPLPLPEVVAIVGHVAAALDAAHRTGVIHRDVKPANILLDRSGNAYLSDFGIAVEEAERLDPEAWLSNGSPAYAPPEQLERRPVGPTADVYALGVAAFESLTGHLPFPTETTMAGLLQRQLHDPIPLIRLARPELPAAVDAVIQKATAKQPEERYARASEFATELAAAAGLEGDAALITPQDRNPYKGLRAFDAADAADFSGRDRLTARLLAAAGEASAVLVVGPSGSGKSSVVRAGLMAALRQGQVRGSGRWFTTTMTPGANPFAALTSALLRVAIDPPADLLAELMADANGLRRVIRRIVPDGRALVLVIDQLEELFTLAGESDRQGFLDALVAALTDAACGLRLVATIRADFYDHPLRHPAFAALVEDSTVSVHPLAADELERAITEPATAVGASFEPRLVAEISADVADQPGALPLLQYALTELFDAREGNVMTRAAYKRLGGVTGALARRAEEVFVGLSAAEQASARRVFGRLVSLGEGTEDTRRRVTRTELGVDGSADVVLDAFGTARLLSFDRDPATREPTVEVAHEALIREWPRLRGWLDEDRDGLRILRHLTESAAAWDASGRPDSELYRGGRLGGAEEWAEKHAGELTAAEVEFVTASSTRALAEIDAERRTSRRLRRRLAAVAVVAAAALIAGVVALQQRGVASERAFNAEVDRMARDAALLASQDPGLSFLVAAAAHELRPGAETLGGLQQALARTDGLVGFLGVGTDYTAVKAVDDQRVVAVTVDAVELWDLDTRTKLNSVSFAGSGSIDLVPGTSTVLTWDGANLVVVDLDAPDEVDQIRSLVITESPAPEVPITAVSASADLVVVGREDGTIDVLRIGDLSWERSIPADGAIAELQFSADGDLLTAMVGPVGAVAWESSTGEEQWRVSWESLAGTVEFTEISQTRVGAGAAMAADGGRESILVRHQGMGTAELEAATGTVIDRWTINLPDSKLDLSPLTDGRLLIGSVVVDRATGEQLDETITNSSTVAGNTVMAGERVLVQATGDGMVLWSLDGHQLLARAAPRRGANFVYLDASGDRLAAINWFQSYHLWDLARGREVAPSLDPETLMIGWLPSGGFMTYETDGETKALDPQTFAESGRVEPGTWSFYTTSRDDKLAAFGPNAPAPVGLIRIVELATAGVVVELDELQRVIASESDTAEQNALGQEQRSGIAQIVFSPDDQYLIGLSFEGAVGVWETDDWQLVGSLPSETGATSAVVTGNGDQMMVRTSAGLLQRYGLPELDVRGEPMVGAAGTALGLIEHPLAFTPGEHRLVVGQNDGAQLWDLDEGRPIGQSFPDDALTYVSPSFDGRFVATGVGDWVLVWNLNTDEWLDIACRAAGRNLTPAEWEQYGPAGLPYRSTCSQWPALG